MAAAVSERDQAGDRRRYRSKLREQQAEQTRRAIVEVARDRFLARGWAATGMRDVADDAGVALETVYAHFSSKRGLLQAVADSAVVGDDAPAALAERADFQALGRGRRPARIRAAARVLAAVQLRTAAVAKLLREAAPADEEIADFLRATRDRQRQDVATGFRLMVGRDPTSTELDGLWVIASPEVYLLLVEQSAWTPEQYESWIAHTFERIIPRQ